METNEKRHSKLATFYGMDVPSLLDHWVERQPDKTFVIWAPFDEPERRWSYAEMAREAKRFAAGLKNRGVGPGDFVLMHLDNSPDFLGAWFACAYLGAVPVTTNTRSVTDNVKYFAEVMQPKCAITDPTYAALLREACGDSIPLIVSGQLSDEQTQALNAEPVDAVFTDAEIPKQPVDCLRNFAVQFTSGTTSRPKATVWSHANALWGGRSMAMNLRLRRDDITLLYMPLFHANAQMTLLSAFWSGGTIVVHPKFSASRFWDACATHDVTWVSMIPFSFKALKGRPVPEHKVRFMIGLERLPDAEQEFGVQTLALWGMTETTTACIVTDPDQPGPAGTMGRPSPLYEIEVRKDDGSLAGPGEQGLLYIHGERGISLFKEYYHNPEKTAEAFAANGALDTGDIVRIDEDGWMFFVNRDKDMLRVGGENVAALEIETAINETGLALECAVVAQKHSMLGEVPAAFIRLKDNNKEMTQEQISERVIQHCREKLADFKVPRSVHLVEDFPRSTLDRIAKNKLRDQLPTMEADKPGNT